MKVIVKQQPKAEWLSYEELLVGEAYYSNGTTDGVELSDGALYLATEGGGIVDILNGYVYPKTYATNAIMQWLYKKANVELVEYTNVSD